MARMTAGAEVSHPKRSEQHIAGLAADAATATEIVGRLRKGRALLARMDGACSYRAEAEALWSTLVMDLYVALRSAYARLVLVREMGDELWALEMWDTLMPDTNDLRDLGAPQLFAHYRGRCDPPEWITDAECRLVTQLIWPPREGEDVFDTGVLEVFDEPPF